MMRAKSLGGSPVRALKRSSKRRGVRPSRCATLRTLTPLVSIADASSVGFVNMRFACRDYARLRYRLFPYNYSLAWQAHSHGTPLMRPLVVEFPSDPNVVDMTSEFMWGPTLLVAPVTRGGAMHWPVYLPSGTWYDFWTHQDVAGDRWIEAAASLERMPMFVRRGAIIPFGPDLEYLGEPGDGSLSLLVYPSESSMFELYEDDGETWAYEQGAYAITRITCTSLPNGVHVVLARDGAFAGMPAQRPVRVQIYLPTAPNSVRVSTEATWHHDDNRFVSLNFSLAAEPVEIEIQT